MTQSPEADTDDADEQVTRVGGTADDAGQQGAVAEDVRAGRGKWLALTAALLGWLFDGLEMGLFPLVQRPALAELLDAGQISVTRATPSDHSPPMPRAAMNRNTTMCQAAWEKAPSPVNAA